jgi:hypothetical protein
MNQDYYSMPVDLIDLLNRQDLSLNALRLVHGLYLAVGMTHPDKKMWGIAASKDCRVRLAALRKTIGPRGAKDNRVYHAAIIELREKSSLFVTLEVIARGQGILCRFASHVVNCVRGRNLAYARFTTYDLAQCRSPVELKFLGNVLLHRNKDRPVFLLPGYEGKQLASRWPKERDRWLRAARKIADKTGDSFLFVLASDDWEADKLMIKVRISHDATAWDTGKLYSMGAMTRLIEVDATGHRYLDVETVMSRRRYAKVPRLQG